MKKIILLLAILASGKAGMAQLKPVDSKSSLQFTIKNFGFDVTGSFTGFDGSINLDPQNSANSSFDVSIDANTVNTDNKLRDEHLRGDSYFNTKTYPRIRFVSTKVSAANKSGTFIVSGKLTIKNQTKSISFPFTALPANDSYAFKGSFKINRKDFGVGGTSTIADELEVTLNVTAAKTSITQNESK